MIPKLPFDIVSDQFLLICLEDIGIRNCCFSNAISPTDIKLFSDGTAIFYMADTWNELRVTDEAGFSRIKQ